MPITFILFSKDSIEIERKNMQSYDSFKVKHTVVV